ncbi:MAG: D-alanyl-D-alanine carboxypeptidase family protein [Pontixanthobacter sp.]
MGRIMKRALFAGLLIASSSGAVSQAGGIDPINGMEAAPIALLIDAQTGQVLYAKEADRRFVPASITKIMTAFIAFELIANGKLDTEQTFALSPTAAETWYRRGSTLFLEPDEPVSVNTLLRGITSVSANDASVVLAEGIDGSIAQWSARMNATAARLGMADSHFATPNGWPDEGATFTSAEDLANLSRELVRRHPSLYARYFGQDGMRYNGFAQSNHDPITGIVDGADGIKTGYTRQAGLGFVGSAMRGGNRLIMVLGGIDNARDRTDISRSFMEWGFDTFERDIAFTPGEAVGTVAVQNGRSTQVAVTAPHGISVLRVAGGPPMRGTLRYSGPIIAPVTAGDVVAHLDVTANKHVVASIPLVAKTDVARATNVGRIGNAFGAWF